MSRRSDVLELAVLGLLDDAPMHGYHLRKHVTALLEPWGSAVSFGTLYPALRRLLAAGFAAATDDGGEARGRRARVVYSLTQRGRRHLRQALADPIPTLGDDECFGVRYAFFSLLRPDERVRVLEVRKAGLLDRLTAARVPDGCRTGMLRDPYRHAWALRGRESVENELRWTETCLAVERAASEAASRPPHEPEPAVTPEQEESGHPPVTPYQARP